MTWKSASPLLRVSHKVLTEEEEEVTVGSEAGKWGHICCVLDRMCLTLMMIHFPEGETEALGAKLFTSEQEWRRSYSVCLDPVLGSFHLRQRTRGTPGQKAPETTGGSLEGDCLERGCP